MTDKRNVLWTATLAISFFLIVQGELAAAILSTGNVEPEIDTWDSNTWAIVGNSSDGTIMVDGGSRLDSRIAFVNLDFFGAGSATVHGEGSQWINAETIYIGGSYSGTLRIEAGGYVRTRSGSLAGGAISGGRVIVNGKGSRWDVNDLLVVGENGAGDLSIESGAQVRSGSAILGRWELNFFSIGRVKINGTGSNWLNSSDLVVGRLADGSLEITDGGLLSVGGVLSVGGDLGGDGFVNIASGGRLALRGNADDSLDEFLALVDGTDTIRYWKNDAVGWAPLVDATLGDDYSLRYLSRGRFAGYTLLTVEAPIPEPNVCFHCLLFSLLHTTMRPVIRNRRTSSVICYDYF